MGYHFYPEDLTMQSGRLNIYTNKYKQNMRSIAKRYKQSYRVSDADYFSLKGIHEDLKGGDI